MSNVNCSFIIEDFESIDPNRHNPLSNFSQRPLAEVQEIWWQTELESSRKKKKKHHHRQQQQQQNTQGLKTQLTLKQYWSRVLITL